MLRIHDLKTHSFNNTDINADKNIESHLMAVLCFQKSGDDCSAVIKIVDGTLKGRLDLGNSS